MGLFFGCIMRGDRSSTRRFTMTALFYIFEEFARRFGYAITIHYAKDSNVASVVMSKGDGYKYVINICKINK
jgi:hypothetical protein